MGDEKVLEELKSLKKAPEIEEMKVEEFDELFQTMPISDDTRCGLGFIQGSFLQK